jgi:cysteine-rich repeat protein
MQGFARLHSISHQLCQFAFIKKIMYNTIIEKNKMNLKQYRLIGLVLITIIALGIVAWHKSYSASALGVTYELSIHPATPTPIASSNPAKGGSGGSRGGSVQRVLQPVFPPESPFCGNGIMETGEQCDDANIQLYDGCSPACVLESNFQDDITKKNNDIPHKINPTDKVQVTDENSSIILLDNFVNSINDEGIEAIDTSVIIDIPKVAVNTTDLIQRYDFKKIVPPGEYHSFDLSGYQKKPPLVTYDSNPVIWVQLKPQHAYELVITTASDKIIARQPAPSDAFGNVFAKVNQNLQLGFYKMIFLNDAYYVAKEIPLLIQQDKMRALHLVAANQKRVDERVRVEKMNLSEGNLLIGVSAPHSTIKAFVQLGHLLASEQGIFVTLLSTQANESGEFSLTIPETFEDGIYNMELVEIYQNGHQAASKSYALHLTHNTKGIQRWINILMYAGLIFVFVGFVMYLKPIAQVRKRRGT